MKQPIAYRVYLNCLVLWFCCFVSGGLVAQQSPRSTSFSKVAFQHLTTADGLSYSGINTICTDKAGNLWVGTGNGLNMFNGKTVTKYYLADYPQLISNNITQVLCDDNNRVWVLTDKRHVAMFDEQRHLHRISLYADSLPLKVRLIVSSKSRGAILFSGKGQYLFNNPGTFNATDTLGQKSFTQLQIPGLDTLQSAWIKQLYKFDEDRYLLSKDTVLYTINYQSKKVESVCALPSGNLLTKWDGDTLLLFNRLAMKLQLVNIRTGAVQFVDEQLKDQFGNTPDDFFIAGEKLSDSRYLLTSYKSGIYIYNRRTGELYNYKHNPSDPSTIAGNQVYNIATNSNGWAFVVTAPTGISYFNAREVIGNQTIFQDAAGKIYDGYIGCVASRDNNIFYLGTGAGLIEWKRSTNTSATIDFKNDKGESELANEEMQTVCFDNNGKLWISTTTKGIYVMDRDKRLVKHILNGKVGNGSMKMRRIYTLVMGRDGQMWASGEYGICRININNFSVDYLENTPLIKLEKTFVSPIYFADSNNIWIGVTDGGVWHYNFLTKQLIKYNKDNGLLSNYIFSICQDHNENIYIGTNLGVNILLRDGIIKSITTKDGLLISRAEAVLCDKKGRVWIGNDIGLACFNIKDSSLRVFDERYGLTIYGFRVNAYYQTTAGEFVFGTVKGLQYFFPESLLGKTVALNALISKIETNDIVTGITNTALYKLASDDNSVTFDFTSVDYTNHLNTFYQYKLEGNDKDWITVTNQNSVHYSSLPPGKYVFKLRVSSNKKDWQNASNEVSIDIATPFYKTWWFRLIGILIGVSMLWFVIRFYRNKQRQKENELETELVITYFASQINKHNDIDELLWDVVKNCISQLHFEDCVIYLLDKEKNVLVQKAAYGPKSVIEHKIVDPIEIPIGKGIVGSVAQKGYAEIVSNTTLDDRYIVDDEQRFSEISVPIFIDNKVVGVIDSEHSRKHFFNNQHLKVMITIAALCAGQMQIVKAEEEKKKAEIELLQNKQKALESRLQSLRLQMNPHFLFNALNSVQQMILANEEMVATRYLSRFSKLLRSILVHSDKETITLKEELDILQLYVELESIRFKDSFKYSIICDEDIDKEEVKVPTLLVQPFVENAIWHGLMHKEGNRELKVDFIEQGDYIRCVIEDNGVGRKKAAEIKGVSLNGVNHQSKGIAVSTERLKSMRGKEGEEGSINFIDLQDADGNGTGTRIEINFPIQ